MIVLPTLIWAPKDPSDRRPYGMEWGEHLDAGDSLTGEPAWSVYPADRGLQLTPGDRDGSSTPLWIEAGQDRTPYRVSCLVQTTNGQTIKRSAILPVLVR